ncbi:MAG: NeuD/PglB/VioB family sugar acetyltransferase [Raineya sp.]|jgi:sugar O-acyltransferase (sialic acid O-acetyltransferase NeuD family)|nr:NeuD/PglB/VioB family sugar acetyltransferase [Raineya sp.]
MKMQILLFPFGGNSMEALDCLDDEFEVLGFVDENLKKIGTTYLGFQVFDRTAFDTFPNAKVLACVGSPNNFQERKDIINNLNLPQERFISVIHPTAQISKYAKIGNNCLIMAGVVITHNAQIGDNVIILPNSVIHHDTKIGNSTCIGSNVVIAGFCDIGESCYIGSGTNIINNTTIGEKTMIGLGTNVTSSFGNRKKIVGNPAREIT